MKGSFIEYINPSTLLLIKRMKLKNVEASEETIWKYLNDQVEEKLSYNDTFEKLDNMVGIDESLETPNEKMDSLFISFEDALSELKLREVISFEAGKKFLLTKLPVKMRDYYDRYELVNGAIKEDLFWESLYEIANDYYQDTSKPKSIQKNKKKNDDIPDYPF